MLKGLIEDAWLDAKVKTGLNGWVVVWSLIAAVALGAAFVFLCISAFFYLETHYDTVTAGLTLAAFFLLVMLIALAACVLARQRALERARTALVLASASRSRAVSPWLDPPVLALGIQVVRMVGFRRLLPLVAAGLVAIELGKEWSSRPEKAEDES